MRVTEPNWLTTLTLAFPPTAYWNSLRLPAASAYVLNTAMHATKRFAFLRFILPLPASARLYATVRGRAQPPRQRSLLPILGRHLVQHLFLVVSTHQRVARIQIVGVRSHPLLRVSDIRIHVFQILAIGICSSGAARGYGTDQLLVVGLECAGTRDCVASSRACRGIGARVIPRNDSYYDHGGSRHHGPGEARAVRN